MAVSLDPEIEATRQNVERTQKAVSDFLDAEFQATKQNVERSQKEVGDWERRQQERQQDDRSLIAKIIVWAFVVLIGVVVVIVAYGTLSMGWDKMSEPAKFLMSILGSVLLPVVTLVIGYYFGKEK